MSGVYHVKHNQQTNKQTSQNNLCSSASTERQPSEHSSANVMVEVPMRPSLQDRNCSKCYTSTRYMIKQNNTISDDRMLLSFKVSAIVCQIEFTLSFKP